MSKAKNKKLSHKKKKREMSVDNESTYNETPSKDVKDRLDVMP